VNERNERSFLTRARAILSINDPRWGRSDEKGSGSAQRPNDPNRRPGKGEGPPDLDEMWRDFNRRLSRIFSFRRQGSGPGERRPDNGRAARVGVGIIIGVLVAIYLGSGIFIVQEGQTGVVLQFGQYRRTVGPGIHFRSPYPFETAEIVNVSDIRSIEIGRSSTATDANASSASVLTQDGDIVDVRFAVRYQVKSPSDYLFYAAEPDRSVVQAAQAAVREIAGARRTDDLLGRDHDALGLQLAAAIQQSLDRYRTGLSVVGVTVQSVEPPQQVQAAFSDAVRASEDRARAKREAQAYANELLPRAQADASRVIDDAKAYADRVVARAQGDADRFNQVYAQYAKAPAVVRERMYLETMRDIYANTTKIFVGGKGGTNIVNLPIDKIIEATRKPADESAASSVGGASAPAAAVPAAPSAASQTAAPDDSLRSRDTLRSRSREDELQQ
jgi:membrane protease subunit HflK